ncbi:MAG TPA: hypothetical protein VHE83_11200 [Mycobacteriales bacterium]|nr:hypothetical protein [Mycobacteriales bacterium]
MSPRPRALGLLGVLLGGVLLTGCAHVTRKDVVIPPTAVAGPLTAAQQAFAGARSAMLAAAAHLPDAAHRLDTIDAAAARGAYDPAKSAQPGATTAVARVGTALTNLPKLADAEGRALDALATAGQSPRLSAAQQQAVAAVVAAARTELTQVRTLAADQRAGWGAYSQLWDAETEWIYRAGAGFFPSQTTGGYDPTVAAQAYTVRTHPIRAAVEHERTGLAHATAALARDADAVAAAIDSASGLFAPDATPTP